ncbi:hypothetical protein GYMLUDRAFT_481104 [Collybiopsis luxurians FD-317 M1]|uniref:Metallo-beta-lactamase domain-containing protein n=1 Tax=Collybiopsis luxurians FD-317 M1 TaxID=944289 RepID=A0A0D0BGR7_9AGAR|nr:hypothetical protein GYMLUDRAFT_481104 [Collybiopsis luxurians FD-317 M1]
MLVGVEHFSDSLIFASSHSPRFLEDIPEHSLCNFLHIRTPKYCPTLVHHGRNLGKTGVTFLHTFGHTPDSLSVYDPTSIPPMLYVGDLFYENEPIIFPNEGSIVEERSTQSDSEQRTILLNAGHITHSRPALLILRSVRSFMEDVIDGREPVRKTWIKRGERTLEYRQDAKTFSLICPERLILEARQSRRS